MPYRHENTSPEYMQKLRNIAAGIGLYIVYKDKTRKRGWPVPSAKPWSLRYGDFTLLASFRTLDQLERNLRGRAGC